MTNNVYPILGEGGDIYAICWCGEDCWHIKVDGVGEGPHKIVEVVCAGCGYTAEISRDHKLIDGDSNGKR